MNEYIHLTSADLQMKWGEGITLLGTPLGEDDYFAVYGHAITDLEIVKEAIRYMSLCGIEEDELRDTQDALVDTPVRRLWARAFKVVDTEWALEWVDITAADTYSFALTLISLQ